MKPNSEILQKLIDLCSDADLEVGKEAGIVLRAVIDKNKLQYHEAVFQDIETVFSTSPLQGRFESDFGEIVLSEDEISTLANNILDRLAASGTGKLNLSYAVKNTFGDLAYERRVAELFRALWNDFPAVANNLLMVMHHLEVVSELREEFERAVEGTDHHVFALNLESRLKTLKQHQE